MQDASKPKHSKNFGERLVSLFKKSVILVFLDNLCCKIYSMLTSGFFAGIFSGYRDKERSFDRTETPLAVRMRKIKDKLSELIERSPIVNFINSYARRFINYRLRVIGLFLLSFGVYTGVFSFVSVLFSNSSVEKYNSYVLSVQAALLILVSIPLIVSRLTLHSALSKSMIASRFLEILGCKLSENDDQNDCGSNVLAVVIGFVAGVSSIIIEPIYVIAGILGLILVYMILSRPEFGAMLLFFFMPLAPTMALAALVILDAFAFLIKIVRSKRIIRFGKVDIPFAIFAAMMLFGGFVSLSFDSIEPALMYFCFICAYFIVSCCIRSREWFMRCMTASIIAALLISLYGIFQYVFADSMITNSAWIDAEMFSDIAGRAVSTLENPNMLGEYLNMIIPMAASLWFSGEWMTRKNSFACFACMCMCLILTWSRGAWIGFVFGFFALLLIWNKRSLWLFIGGVLSLPVLPFILPEAIVNRITSIGNLADSSTSYRVSIWRSAMHMAKDHIFSGIGVGKDAWNVIYDDYALPGISVAAHAHNLYLQITVEIGIFGLLIFLIAIFMMFQYGFSLFSRLKNTAPSLSPLEPSNQGPDALKLRMSVAGPLCGILTVIIQGFTDYSWYNYRVTLMFWLVAGLAVGMTKCGRECTPGLSAMAAAASRYSDENKADTDIPISDR